MYNTHLDFHTFSDARSALCSASSDWHTVSSVQHPYGQPLLGT